MHFLLVEWLCYNARDSPNRPLLPRFNKVANSSVSISSKSSGSGVVH